MWRVSVSHGWPRCERRSLPGVDEPDAGGGEGGQAQGDPGRCGLTRDMCFCEHCVRSCYFIFDALRFTVF